MKNFQKTLLLLLLLLLCLSACGTNFPAATSSGTPASSKFSNIPLGKGMNPEPGTDGKPAPLPNGHGESMIIANGVGYVGSDNGTLYALDTGDGAGRWSYKIGSAVSLYSVVDGVVYATGNTALYALNVQSGKLLWRYQGSKWIAQAIVVAGVVYTATAADNNASALVALRAADGRQLWNYTAAAITPALLGVVDGIVYASSSADGPEGLSSRYIDALRASDGHVVWNIQLGSGAGLANGGVVAMNGLAYFVTSQGSIYAVRMDTGSVAWHISQPSVPGLPPNAPTPTLANGLLYVASPSGLFAYNASDGKLIWQYKEPFPGGPIVVLPTIVNGVVYFGSVRETIVALRASDGEVIWSHSGPGDAFRPLTVVNGMVINDSGPVYALRASDGKLLWQQNVSISGEGSDAAGPETVGDGVVLVGGDNGVVQAIRVSDGKLLWHYAIQELPVQSPPVYSAYIFFAPSTSYQQALEIVTSLGLKTFDVCQPSWATSDNKTFFANDHEMTVLASANSAPLWLNRLQATSGIEMVQAGTETSCPNMPYNSGPAFLPASQANTYVQVTFASTTQYATALDAVNGLGFRLATPCYEQARARGNKPTWQSQDQSAAFNQSHTLILATTRANAVTWQSQLGSVRGVVKVDTPFKAAC